MSVLYFLVAWFTLVLTLNEAARILGVFPTPSISHQVVFRPLTQALAARGHEVIVITTDPVFSQEKSHANLTEIDVHDISYNIWKEKFITISKGNKDDLVVQMKAFFEAMTLVFEAQLKNQYVQNMLLDKNQKFDLILAEACVRPALIFSHIYKAPVIQVSSLGAAFDNYENIGAPVHPFLYPAITRQRINNLTIWEKFSELYTEYLIDNAYENMKVQQYEMLRSYFGDRISLSDNLDINVDMLFLNEHPIFVGIRPVPPTVVFMGGLHQKPNKNLPTDLKTYLDSSKNGVIYISFGTNVDTSLLPPNKVQAIVQVVSKLPYDVLWKWNEDELPGRSSNIRISKWLPQADLLKHKNIKLFITQGGLQSTDEAITAGVPLIGVPMLGDQWFNVERYEYHKIGIRLDMEMLTEQTLTKAINTVIDDKSYRRNIEKLREVILDQPMQPLERAIWWTEYVLRHGGASHLRSPAANISWAQYLELELVLIILFVLFVAIVSVLKTLCYIYNYVVRSNITVKIKYS